MSAFGGTSMMLQMIIANATSVTDESGFVTKRDQAAALSMLVDGLRLSGWEPAWTAGPETPSRVAERLGGE
jgi:hypothetical protein